MKKMKIKNPDSIRSRGFTLIEVLIVVAIVAILITFLVPNFMGIRMRARDTKRKSDLTQIQKALELYKSDQDPPAYPPSGYFTAVMCQQCWSSEPDCAGSVYMHKVPCDPASPADSPYVFNVNANDDMRYLLSACLENDVDTEKDAIATTECATLNRESFTVNEP